MSSNISVGERMPEQEDDRRRWICGALEIPGHHQKKEKTHWLQIKEQPIGFLGTGIHKRRKKEQPIDDRKFIGVIFYIIMHDACWFVKKDDQRRKRNGAGFV